MKQMGCTNLIELVTQINWIDVVAFEVGEHDDLGTARDEETSQTINPNDLMDHKVCITHEKHHGKQQSGCHEHRKEK